jgi:hypothetical protein
VSVDNRELRDRALVALLLLVGGGAVLSGVVEVVVLGNASAPALFDVALGVSVLLVTWLFLAPYVFPRAVGMPTPGGTEPSRPYLPLSEFDRLPSLGSPSATAPQPPGPGHKPSVAASGRRWPPSSIPVAPAVAQSRPGSPPPRPTGSVSSARATSPPSEGPIAPPEAPKRRPPPGPGGSKPALEASDEWVSAELDAIQAVIRGSRPGRSLPPTSDPDPPPEGGHG